MSLLSGNIFRAVRVTQEHCVNLFILVVQLPDCLSKLEMSAIAWMSDCRNLNSQS